MAGPGGRHIGVDDAPRPTPAEVPTRNRNCFATAAGLLMNELQHAPEQLLSSLLDLGRNALDVDPGHFGDGDYGNEGACDGTLTLCVRVCSCACGNANARWCACPFACSHIGFSFDGVRLPCTGTSTQVL